MSRLSLNLTRPKRRKRLNIAAIPDCELWIDIAQRDSLHFANNANVDRVADLSGKNRHLTKTGTGYETVYPVHLPAENGLKFLSNAYDHLIAGQIGDWDFLHDGSGCTILMMVKVDAVQNANAVLLSTASEASDGVGTNLWYFNTNQNYNVTTRNGASQTFYHNGANLSLAKGDTTILSVHMESRPGNPPDLIGRSNGKTDLKTSNLSTYNTTSSSTGVLHIGKLPTANFKCNMVVKKLAIFSRRLRKAEENAILDSWAQEESIAITRYGARDLAIIAGQSNASGRGLIAESDFAPDATIANASIFNSTAFTWSPLQAGVTNAAYSTSHLGMEMQLAQSFTTLSEKPLQLVKYAADGISLNSWTHGNSNFTNLQTAITRAHWQLEDDGYVVQPFFIWYQGESDAQSESDANAYRARLQDFMDALMQTPGFEQMPSYLVEIAQDPVFPHTDTVRHAAMQHAMTKPYSAYTRFIETSDIAILNDRNHLDAASLGLLGERIAKRHLRIAE